MILKKGQQLLFVANGLVFTKRKCILRVPEIIQKKQWPSPNLDVTIAD